MNGVKLSAVMIAGLVIFTAAALCITYNKYNDTATEVLLDAGLSCTINDNPVKDGETVNVHLKNGYLNLHVESDDPAVIGYFGKWTSSEDTSVRNEQTGSEVTAADFRIFVGYGEFIGNISIKNMNEEVLQHITLTFNIDESNLTVKHGSDIIHNNDVIELTGDDMFTVTTNDGQKHNITYTGKWSNPCGESSGLSGSHYTNSATIIIKDMIHYEPASGTMEIKLADLTSIVEMDKTWAQMPVTG